MVGIRNIITRIIQKYTINLVSETRQRIYGA